MGVISMQGGAPFALPLTKTATAQAEGETVVVTLHVAADERGPIAVEVPMTAETARLLGAQACSASVQAESNRAKNDYKR
jgi:hypothetical protein